LVCAGQSGAGFAEKCREETRKPARVECAGLIERVKGRYCLDENLWYLIPGIAKQTEPWLT
jgi:hypothetical protein